MTLKVRDVSRRKPSENLRELEAPRKGDQHRGESEAEPDRQVLSLENRLQDVVPVKLVAQVQPVRTPTKPNNRKTLAQQNGQSLVRGAAASPLLS